MRIYTTRFGITPEIHFQTTSHAKGLKYLAKQPDIWDSFYLAPIAKKLTNLSEDILAQALSLGNE